MDPKDRRSRWINEKINNIEPGSYDEMLQTAILVCIGVPDSGELDMPGNLTGKCDRCRATIQFRPMNQKAPVKFCVFCAMKVAKEPPAEA